MYTPAGGDNLPPGMKKERGERGRASFADTIALTMVLFFTAMVFCFAALGIPARIAGAGEHFYVAARPAAA
jgi:hypothetical protein